MGDTLQQAVSHYQAKRIEESVRTLESMQAQGAVSDDAKHLLAICYYRQSRFSDAEALFTELSARHPHNGDVWHYLALTLEHVKKFEQAARAYKQLARIRSAPPANGHAAGNGSSAGMHQEHDDLEELSDEVSENGRTPNGRSLATFSDLILSQSGPQSAAIAQLIKETALDRRAMLTAFLFDLVLVTLLYAGFPVALMCVLTDGRLIRGAPETSVDQAIVAIGIPAACLGLLFAIAQVKSQRYIIRDGYVRVRRGLILKRAENLELYKVTDLSLRQSPFSFLTGSGEIVLTGAGTTTRIRGIARGRKIEQLYERLRLLVAMLRTTPLTKGLFQ